MNNRKMEDKMNILIIKSFQFFDEVKKKLWCNKYIYGFLWFI